MALKRLQSLSKLLKQNVYSVPNIITISNKTCIQDLLFRERSPLKIEKYSTSCNNKNSKYGANCAVVLHGVKDLKIEERAVPKLKDNQVLLKMEVVGICGSDVHYYLDGKIGPFVVKKPMIIGHEASGIVMECGKKVTELKSGDKVALEPQFGCRQCSFCKSGRYNLCPKIFFCATPPDDGCLCTYYAHDADFCHKLPCTLDFEHGTLMEPLSVGVHLCRRAQVSPGDSVLILGSGPIGLTTLLAAKAYGAYKTVVVDINNFKLKKAKEIGADYCINIQGCSEKDIVKAIHDTLGHQPNKTFECSGFEQGAQVGLYATKSGGKMVLAGLGKDLINLPITEIVIREVDLLGIFRYANDYPVAIKMVERGQLDPKPLITQHFKFEDAVKAFETASDGKTDFIKIMIHLNPEWKPENKC